MERKLFYDYIRNYLFNGKLMQDQVDGIEILLDEWERKKLIDTRWLAYILATTFHETACTMQPIAEYGKGENRPYGKPNIKTGKTYYGRGYVQLTWLENYQRFSKKLNIDLVNQPDLAMEPEISCKIISEGMINGMFTGRKLGHYFHENSDWYNARRIVNGLDRANKIAKHARAFWHAILMAERSSEEPTEITKSLHAPFVRKKDYLIPEIEEISREFSGI